MAGTLLYSDKVPVAAYDTYAEAERAVDSLSDKGFPAQHPKIVGVCPRTRPVVTDGRGG
jgi:hypothetical protein